MDLYKKIIPLIFIVFLSGCTMQQKIPETQVLESQYIVEVDQVSKGVLFERSKQFLAEAFRSAQAVIQYQDFDEGRIMGKGVINAPEDKGIAVIPWTFNFSFVIDVKANKARLTTADYRYARNNMPLKYTDALDAIQPKLDELGALFKSRMVVPVKSDDW